jgi:hypothetical protein
MSNLLIDDWYASEIILDFYQYLYSDNKIFFD